LLEPAHNTISEMMEKHATEAVRLAPTFGCALDYSEDSLRQLENILAQLSAEAQRSGIDTGANDSVQKRVDADPRIWGGYFGETIRWKHILELCPRLSQSISEELSSFR
jgi:ketosteroid isomerase-like protein